MAHHTASHDSRVHRVGVIAFDGAQLLDVTGPTEVFHQANRLGADYRVSILGWDSLDVDTSSHVRLRADAMSTDRPAGRFDTLIVSGADELPMLPSGTAVRERIDAITTDASRIASICTGAFLLAGAGYLDGHRATTHWRHAEALRRRFPLVEVAPDAVFVRSGRFATSAGVTTGIDLTLSLVEDDHGPDLARDVARELVVFLRRPGGQSQFSVRQRIPETTDTRLRRLVDEITDEPTGRRTGGHTVESLAARASLTTRHLRRLFQTELGVSPATFVEQTRTEAGRMLLEQGANVTEAARTAGFASDEAFRRAFHQEHGVTPSTYQARFRRT